MIWAALAIYTWSMVQQSRAASRSASTPVSHSAG
jgi:hypothetical protein